MAEARVQPEACGDLNIRCQGLDGRTHGEHAIQARASSDPAGQQIGPNPHRMLTSEPGWEAGCGLWPIC